MHSLLFELLSYSELKIVFMYFALQFVLLVGTMSFYTENWIEVKGWSNYRRVNCICNF